MKELDEKMSEFLKGVNESNTFTSKADLNFEDLKKYPLEQNECFYVFDLTKNKIVYLRGFDTFLGYNESELDLDSIFGNYHPDDAVRHRPLKPSIQNSSYREHDR